MSATARRNRWVVVSVLAIGLFGLLAAGCGGSSGDDEGGGTPSLTVGLPGANDFFAGILTAQGNGYFEDAGVDVELVNGGATVTQDTSTGRMDLTFTGLPAALPPAVQGHQTAIVYCWYRGDPSAGVVVNAESKFQTVEDLAGERVSVQGVGTASYGNGNLLSEYLESQGQEPLELVPVNTTGGIDTNLSSGQVAAFVGSPGQLSKAIDAGKFRLILDPTSSEAASIFGGKNVCANGVWGLKSTIEKKGEAVTKFLSAVAKADQYLVSHSRDEIAESMLKSPLLVGYTQDQLAELLKFDEPWFPGEDTSIDESQWESTKEQVAHFGLDIDLAAPELEFSEIIDMSYLDDARGEADDSQ